MDLFQLIPTLSKILDRGISSTKELREVRSSLEEIDIRELEARLGVQKEWLGNKSAFVAGAIPMILWMVSIVVGFNCLLSPLLSPIWPMPVIELPEWYSSLAGTVIIGLFTKKAFDGNAISIGRVFSKPAKGDEADEGKVDTAAAPPKPVAKKAAAPAQKSTMASVDTKTPTPEKYDTPEKIDARLEALAQQYGARK